MSVLLIAEHDNSNLKPFTFNAITAASKIDSDVHVLVAGTSCENVSKETANIPLVKKVLVCDSPNYQNYLPENLAPLVIKVSEKYDHIVASANTFGKNLNMNRICWIIPLFLTLLYCESDDICPESTPTTPRLIITFYDVENPESKKNIESLGVYTVNNGELNIIEGINGINTDSIAIPLRDDESVTNFKFCKDFSEDITVIQSGLLNHVYFDYEIIEIFVSRACGFINNYNLSIAFPYYPPTPPGLSNWISEIIIINDSITNENQSHVKILH